MPLKWHYPIGLLYDLYAGADPASKTSPGKERDSSLLLPRKQRRSANTDSDSESERGDSSLPWRLTVHFNDWPEQDLVRLDDHGIVIHDAFINSVKEADFLRNGTAKGIMSLSKEDSSGLWKAVEQGEHEYLNCTSCFLFHSRRFPSGQKWMFKQTNGDS